MSFFFSYYENYFHITKRRLDIIEKSFSEFNFTRDITPAMYMNNKYHGPELFALGERIACWS